MAKVIKIDKDALRSRWDYNDIQKKIRIKEIKTTKCPNIYHRDFPWTGVILYMDEFISSYCGKTNEGLYDLRGFNFDNVVPLKYKNKYWHFNFKNCSNVDFSFTRNDNLSYIWGNFRHCKFYRCVYNFKFMGILHNCIFERYSGSGRLGGIENYNCSFTHITCDAFLDNSFVIEFFCNKTPQIYENCTIMGKKHT